MPNPSSARCAKCNSSGRTVSSAISKSIGKSPAGRAKFGDIGQRLLDPTFSKSIPHREMHLRKNELAQGAMPDTDSQLLTYATAAKKTMVGGEGRMIREDD